MSKFKKIFDNNCAFGGVECHVTGNNLVVHILMRHAPTSGTFRVVARLTVAEWDQFVEKHNLFDAYNRNPAVLVKAFSNNSTKEEDVWIRAF